MFRPLAVYIGLRYTRAKRRNHFISFISGTSILGLALGVTALITVLSVMNGFELELRSRILGMTAHATIVTPGGTLARWEELLARVRGEAQVRGAAPFVRGEAMATNGAKVQGVMVRGILPAEEAQVSVVGERMMSGELEALAPGEYRVVLGIELANALGARVGERVTLVAPQPNVSVAGILPRLKQFRVAGLFEIGMHEYDSALALVHMQDAARLFRLDEGVSGIRLELDDVFQAPVLGRRIAARMAETTGREDLAVIDWTQYHTNFFRALKTEKTVMFVILMLIVAVAAFNIVSTLVMVVTDKRSEVAVLRTLGVSPAQVMRIFMVQGTVIGLAGTLLGLGGGIWLAVNVETLVPALERMFSVDFLPSDVYYISDLPSELHWPDVWRVSLIAFGLCLLATVYPAWQAGRTQPAEALRYE